MNFFHGSKIVVEKPRVQGSNPHNDYGPSFYLTMDEEAAKLWACRNDSPGFVNRYFVDKVKFQSFKVLDLTKKEEYGVLNWLAILMRFRTLDDHFAQNNKVALDWLSQYYVDVERYDVVIGYRADDAYFRFPIRFLTGALSYDDLEDVYRAGNLGVQYAFRSKRAIDALKFVSATECGNAYIGRYYDRIAQSSKEFDELLSLPLDPKKTYVLDLIRRGHE